MISSLLPEWLHAAKITVAFLPTPVAEAVLKEKWPEGSALRHLLTGGDKLHHPSSESDSFVLTNHYGPTESTVVATASPVYQDHAGQHPPIGKPIANTQVYVVDEEMEAVPVGVAGELYIGGEGLARGYLNRPELTAERFVPNPFVTSHHGRSTTAGGQRLYRTGDQVRWLGDGNLKFLSRLDQQVKIRGFRIELGEIEAALQQCAGVRQAVVIAREDEPGNKRLVAYVVAAGAGEELESRELREQLKGRLPEYMVPIAYVRMEELPLTPNGKLDRKRLPQPEQREAGSGSKYQAPRTAEEEILCGIWEQVLKVDRVGVAENFFELGGHSLLATQVIARVREAFAVELPLRVLFEKPTVAGMSEELKEARQQQQPVSQPLVRVPNRAELPLSYAQQRLWFLEQMEPGNAVYNIPLALRLRGELDREALKRSFNRIVERHEVLRTVFGLNAEQEPVQRVLGVEEIGFGVEEVELGHVGVEGEERE